MVVADVGANILTQSSDLVVGSNSKLVGEDVSELVIPSDYPVGGLGEDGRVNLFDDHRVDPLLGSEISLSLSLS